MSFRFILMPIFDMALGDQEQVLNLTIPAMIVILILAILKKMVNNLTTSQYMDRIESRRRLSFAIIGIQFIFFLLVVSQESQTMFLFSLVRTSFLSILYGFYLLKSKAIACSMFMTQYIIYLLIGVYRFSDFILKKEILSSLAVTMFFTMLLICLMQDEIQTNL